MGIKIVYYSFIFLPPYYKKWDLIQTYSMIMYLTVKPLYKFNILFDYY